VDVFLTVLGSGVVTMTRSGPVAPPPVEGRSQALAAARTAIREQFGDEVSRNPAAEEVSGHYWQFVFVHQDKYMYGVSVSSRSTGLGLVRRNLVTQLHRERLGDDVDEP